MGYLHFSVLLIIIATVSAASINKNESTDPLAVGFFNLPDDEKENFLSYFLAQGVMHKSMISYPGIRKAVIIKTVQQPVGLNITDDQIRKFQSMNIPEESVGKLVNWTKSKFVLEDAGIAQLARRKEVCNSQGQCITVPDVGTLCCPW